MKPFKLFEKTDIALILFWGSCALVLFLISFGRTHSDGSGTKLTVLYGNNIYGIYDLDRDQTIEINDGNICEIKDGEVRMTYADCPDKLCMHSRAISGAGENIVCLPNHVILKITGDGEEPEIDGLSE